MTDEDFKAEVTQFYEGDLRGLLRFLQQVHTSQEQGWKLTTLEGHFAAYAGKHGWGGLLRMVAEAFESWPEEKQR